MFHCLVKLCFGMARDSERMNCEQSVIFFANHAYITHIPSKSMGIVCKCKHLIVLSETLSLTNSWHDMYLLLRSSWVSLDSFEVFRSMLNRQLHSLFKILLL